MIHIGDVTKVNGAAVEPVDCITFGSPCQDLSVAGLRKGLGGERSGLFMEAVRIIKEMREHEHSLGRTGVDIRPRFAIWENVPGAFSSNKGEDFRVVLEELAHIVQADVTIPGRKKWEHAGLIIGDSWSIAWRTVDAQYWGVPQRRKRIALVMDFNGRSAGEILFESESLPGDSEQSIPTWEDVARTFKDSTQECHGYCFGIPRETESDSYTLKIRGGGGKGFRREESREGCFDSDGTFSNIGSESRSDTFRIDRKRQ